MSRVLDCYGDATDRLRAQLERAAEIPYYERAFTAADVAPGDLETIDDLERFPFTTTSDLAAAYDGGRGPFYDPAARHLFMTPVGEQLIPVYYGGEDMAHMSRVFGEQFQEAGLETGHMTLNTAAYNIYPGGLFMHYIVQSAGATPIAVGPGDAAQSARLAADFTVNAIVGSPSFGEKIANASDRDLSLDAFIGSGEPIASFPERREHLRDLFGGETTVVDMYGTAEVGLVACECRHEAGMNVNEDYAIIEVIDPETGTSVETGEEGEIVVTHLAKDVMPLVRFRTGDVTRLVEHECGCGRPLTLPDGVFGRTDNRLKVKGVKVYPGSVQPVLAEYQGATGEYLIEVSRSTGETDRLTITVETTDAAEVDVDELADRLAHELRIRPDEIVLTAELETDERVRDERTESIT